MTKESELLESMDAVIRRMEQLGAKRSYKGEDYVLDKHYVGMGPGWAIVWVDPKNGGIDPVVNLGDNKAQAQRTCWDILGVLGCFSRE